MAAVRSKGNVPVGSAQWIEEERGQIAVFRDQESEDFAFSARNEVDWLNEHMAEIFSNNQINVTEIFKTPGKLRGKTPRTARKRDPLEMRAPLTDVFSTNTIPAINPVRIPQLNSKLEEIQQSPRQDKIAKSEAVPKEPIGKKVKAKPKANTDSGYHGMSEDDMEVDQVPNAVLLVESVQEVQLPLDKMEVDSRKNQLLRVERISDEDATTENSFHSAPEIISGKGATIESEQSIENLPLSEPRRSMKMELIESQKAQLSGSPTRYNEEQEELPVAEEDKDSILEEDHDSNVSHFPSEGSSPAKPLVRKSSLSFASLPAREPLTTKKSLGARVSRTSHVEQSKQAPVNRNSYFGRYTEGKSLGGIRPSEQVEDLENGDDMDLDNVGKSNMAREESDGDSRIAKLHNKSSTQRLHERINLLGQNQTARPTKPVNTSSLLISQPTYPELPKSGAENPSAKVQGSPKAMPAPSNHLAMDEDDEWIRPPTEQSEQLFRPPLTKGHTVDVIEQLRKIDAVEGQIPTISNKTASTQRLQPHGLGHKPSLSTSAITLPVQEVSCEERPHKKAISVSNVTLPTIPSTTPAGSPTHKQQADGPLHASKSKLQSIMMSARGLFTSSAGASAQAKLEGLSPSSMRLRNQGQEVAGMVIPRNDTGPLDLNRSFHSDLVNSSYPSIQRSPSGKSEGRKTRSSTEKEEKRREKEEKDRLGTNLDLENAREHERQKAAKLREQRTISAESKIDAGKTPREAVPKKMPQPIRQSPRRPQNREQTADPSLAIDSAATSAEDTDLAQSMGPPPSRPQPQTSQLQKPKEMKRPVKPAKEAAPKPRPQPVAIRVGTLSQRIPLTNAAISSSLQDTLPPSQSKHPVIVKKNSTASIQTTTSTNSFKSSSSSIASKPKALIAADRKREQDEKEAQRKLEHKREMERRRAAQQEEVHRRDQQQRQDADRQREKERAAAVEVLKKAAQKQAVEKRRLELSKKEQQRETQITASNTEKPQDQAPAHRVDLGAARPPSRLNGVQDFSKAPINYPIPNPAKPPIKRVFEPDQDDELLRPSRAQGAPSFPKPESKRRRTDDEDALEAPVRPAMAPPLRQSSVRKDNPKASIFSNNHTAGPSLSRTSAMNQPYQQHPYHNQAARPPHTMDMAKYTNGKIPFAETPNPPPHTHKTPMHTKQAMAGPSKSSPMFPNSDNIHLEDIPTDSDEEDSEDEREKKKNLPDWVLTPNLDERLRAQERINPDVLFGPVAPLVMEEIFKDKNRHHKFRSRTSSANWFGQDRLTEEEVRADNAAREKLRKEGGWSFGL